MTTELAPNNLGPPFPGPSGDSALHARYRTFGAVPERNTKNWGSSIRPDVDWTPPEMGTSAARFRPRAAASRSPRRLRRAALGCAVRVRGDLVERDRAAALRHLHA